MSKNPFHELMTLRSHEILPACFAIGHYFFVLCALFVLRPVRETFGLARGVDELSWLFMGTLLVTLVANPIFGGLVSRFSRRIFIPITYLAFAASLVVFWAIATFAPAAVGERSGQVFYIWLSVFNVFSVMVFWAYMADGFTPEQSRRLYGILAIGGTLGALVGSAITGQLASLFGDEQQHLILVSIVAIFCAIACALLLGTHFKRMAAHPAADEPANQRSTGEQPVAGDAIDGLFQVVASPYLLGICLFIFIMTILATFLYFAQMRIVDDLIKPGSAQTEFFATVDVWTQTATLVAQLFVTGYVMRFLGVGLALTILPVIIAGAFVGLADAPSLGMLTAVMVASRAGKYAFARPARETLFNVLSRSEKYKAKSFIDTFVYRTGDVVGALTDRFIRAASLGFHGVCVVAAPLILIWIGVAVWLGFARRNYESRTERLLADGVARRTAVAPDAP